MLFSGDDLFGVGDAFDGLGDAGAEFEGLVAELLVREGFESGFVAADFAEAGEQLFDGTFVAGAEDFGDGGVEQGWFPFLAVRCGTGTRRSSFAERMGLTGCGVRRENGAGSVVFLQAGAGDGVQAGGVCGGRSYRPWGAVLREFGGGQVEVEGLAGELVAWGLDACGGLMLREEHADVMCAEAVVAVSRGGAFCDAKRGEEEEDTGEMDGAKTHLSGF